MIDVVSLTAAMAMSGAKDLPESRRESLRIAAEMGADADTIRILYEAMRVAREATIVLPCHRFESLSRGKGWARKGRGDKAEWGSREAKGYRVGPGDWIIGANDGFSRKGQDEWTVSHVRVGAETWTVAS